MTPYPELTWLAAVVGEGTGRKLSSVPGGWRGLSVSELDSLGLTCREKRSVLALQRLTELGYPMLTEGRFADADDVMRVYSVRLGGLSHEMFLVVGVDAQQRFIGEFEVSRGGRRGAAIMAADIFRPLIRAGCASALLIHNHPGGNPTPSSEDIALTDAAVLIGGLVGIPVLDHVIIGGAGGGAASLWCLGIIKERNTQ